MAKTSIVDNLSGTLLFQLYVIKFIVYMRRGLLNWEVYVHKSMTLLILLTRPHMNIVISEALKYVA